MSENLLAMLNNEDGATLTEYSLIVGLIAFVCVAALTNVSSHVQILLKSVSTKF